MRKVKPLLIIPPAPARWSALEDLYRHKGPPWITDIRQRVAQGVAGARDAFAVVARDGHYVAGASISKSGELGILGHCYTRPEERHCGHARALLETLLAWFDMTGGRALYLGTTSDLEVGLYGKLGFVALRRLAWSPHERLTMVRTRGAEVRYTATTGEVSIRPLTRADWPAMVVLLQYRAGPDPRVALDESAVAAEAFTLDLIDHQERGAGQLLGAFKGPQLVGFGSVASDRTGPHTYGMLVPHDAPEAALRAALIESATGRGYAHVDFPLESLGRS